MPPVEVLSSAYYVGLQSDLQRQPCNLGRQQHSQLHKSCEPLTGPFNAVNTLSVILLPAEAMVGCDFTLAGLNNVSLPDRCCTLWCSLTSLPTQRTALLMSLRYPTSLPAFDLLAQ